MSKLGLYVIRAGDVPVDWFARAQPAVAVSMDPNPAYWRAVKAASPRTLLLGREYVHESQQVFGDPLADARRFFERMKLSADNLRGVYDGWMAYNESAVWNPTEAAHLSAFHVEWARLCHAAGFRCGAYSFPEGHPDLALWPYLVDGVRACDWLFLHEYDAPEMWRTQGWRCLRYRQVYSALPPDVRAKLQIVVTETGLDGGVRNEATGQPFAPQRGWKHFGDMAHYLDSLKWYDGELQRDPYVVGAAIFAAKWDTGGGTFDVADEAALRDYIGSGGPPMPHPSPAPAPAPAMQAWCPFATARPVPFASYGRGRMGHGVKAIVLHIADGPLAAIWPTFANPANPVSTHFAIGKRGEIEQYVGIDDTAYGNGLTYAGGRWHNARGKEVTPAWSGLEPGVNPNLTTISIEHEGRPGEPMTPQMADAQYRLLGWLAGQTKDASGHPLIYTPREVLIEHAQLDNVDRANCPGPALSPEIVLANMMRPR